MFRSFISAAAVLAVLFFGLSGQDASAQQFVQIQGVQQFSGQMICVPTPGSEDAAQIAIGVSATQILQNGTIVMDIPIGDNEETCYVELMSTGLFDVVEPNWEVFPTYVPNDSGYSSQWGHQWMNMESAWDLERGDVNDPNAVVIATCDTGVLATHNDLLKQLEGYNAVDRLWESQGGNTSAVHYHGTMTTGFSGAVGDNFRNVAGVHFNARTRMMRVSNSTGGSSNISTLQHAIMTAVDSGDRVVNVSYSGVFAASNRVVGDYVNSVNAILFWSAGNDNMNRGGFDRDVDHIQIVGSLQNNTASPKSTFSAYGKSVDFFAPGTSVVSTHSSGDNATSTGSGTSYASPKAAGLAALIITHNPLLTAAEVVNIMKSTCDDLGAPGLDDTFSYGSLNGGAALAAAGGGGGPGPVANSLKVTGEVVAVAAGATGTVFMTNNVEVYGLSFVVVNDPTVITAQTVTKLDYLTVNQPEFWLAQTYTNRAVVGFVMSMAAPQTFLPITAEGFERPLVNINYQAVGGSGSNTALTLTPIFGTVRTEFSLAEGLVVIPTLTNGQIGVGNSFVRADGNQDGIVTLSDAVYTLTYLFVEAANSDCISSQDTNDDGLINIADVMQTLNYIFGTGTGDPTPPAPFPSCGVDPTPDSLDCNTYLCG